MTKIKWESDRSGEFVAVEVEGFLLPLNRPIDPTSGEYQKIGSAIMGLSEFVDFSKLRTGWVSKWPHEELEKLVSSRRFTSRMKSFFKILLKHANWVPKPELDEELEVAGFEVEPQTVAGITGPITRLCNQKGKDALFEKMVQGDEYHYRLNPFYRPNFETLLSEGK